MNSAKHEHTTPVFRRVLLAGIATLALSSQAHAWDSYSAPAQTPTDPPVSVTNAPTGGTSHAKATATAGSATATGGTASATSSPSLRVIVRVAPAAAATAPAVATPIAASDPSGDPTDPSGARHGGAGHGGGRGGGNTTINDNTAPQITLPSIGGGGGDCPVVGFGVGGSGLGGGGGFGPSWISSRCDHRKYAELLAELQGKAAALAYLCRVEADTCTAAPVATSATVPISTAPASPATDCAAVNLAQTGHGRMSPAELQAYRACHA